MVFAFLGALRAFVVQTALLRVLVKAVERDGPDRGDRVGQVSDLLIPR